MRILIFLLLLANLFLIFGQNELQPQIETVNGILRGTIERSVKNRTFYAFKGIPYAKPPVGKHRFKDPIPVKPWHGVWDASQYGSECLQMDFVTQTPRLRGDEDCLFINVFTPKVHSAEAGQSLDVIVFIHGGAFIYGSSFQYGPEILMDRDVVFVTLNYRLGPLGFLSTEDDIVPGNMGLKDQLLALKWIQQNIAVFGGNPNSVTFIGSSAGAASVHYHYISPLSKGLFHRGISVSGSSFNSWTQQEAALEKAKKIGAELGCPTFNTRELIECLRKRPARRIVQLVEKFQIWYNNPFSPFAPVVEKGGANPFLVENPVDSIRAGRMQDLPWITSITQDEGIYPIGVILANPKLVSELDQKWINLAPYILDYNYTVSASQKPLIADLIRKFYLQGDKSFGINKGQELIDMISDRIFTADIVRAAKMQAAVSTSPVYFYKFSYRGQQSLSDFLSNTDIDFGVSHADDLSYTIKTLYMDTGLTSRDKEMREMMLDFWVQFASTGKPDFGGVIFEPVQPYQDLVRYLEIFGPNDIRMNSDENMGKVDFWDSLPIIEPQVKAGPLRKIDEL